MTGYPLAGVDKPLCYLPPCGNTCVKRRVPDAATAHRPRNPLSLYSCPAAGSVTTRAYPFSDLFAAAMTSSFVTLATRCSKY